MKGAGWFGRVGPAGQWGLLLALLWAPVCIADIVITGGALAGMLLLGGGPIAGVYTMLLYLARPTNPREMGKRVSGAVFLLFVGIFHFAWAGMLVLFLQGQLDPLGEFALVVRATGVVYALLLGLLCLSWRVAALVLAGTTLATATAAIGTALAVGGAGGAAGAPGPSTLSLFVPIAILHATLGIAMFIDCSRRQRWWDELHAQQVCLGCGYSLSGLAGGPCPECGRPRAARAQPA